MGSNTSKVNTEFINRPPKNDVDTGPSTDPRSPTPEIARTPLQNKAGSKHNITKNADLRKTFEGTKGDDKLIHNNPILSAVIKNHLQSYDPRSPTQEFDRTPIVISSNVEELTNEEKFELLQCGSPSLRIDDDDECITAVKEIPNGITATKNLCNGFFDLTLDDTLKESDAPLGSSTASQDSIEKNMSNETADIPKQLLETNFDYVETNTDETEENYETPGDITDENPMKMAPAFKLLDLDPRSPSTGIDRTPLVVPKKIDKSKDENVEEMSDDSLIKVLQSTNAELKQVNGHNKNSEGLLIYEDETAEINVTPKKAKSACSSASRTPLSCMKNKDAGHTRSKSANTATDNKEQTGLTKRASHIPRLKALSKQVNLISGSNISLKSLTKVTGISGDCENTPPQSHRDNWDKDNSIVL